MPGACEAALLAGRPGSKHSTGSDMLIISFMAALTMLAARSENPSSASADHAGFVLRIDGLAPSTVARAAAMDSCAQPNNRPYFDFQVDKPAKFARTSDSTMAYPDASLHQTKPFTEDFALAQFVVDTGGKPVASTLKLLTQPSELTLATVSQALEHWRFEAALLRGCPVAQLMQTPLRWK